MFAPELRKPKVDLTLVHNRSGIVDTSSEVNSVEGGYSKHAMRYKLIGDFSMELLSEADSKYQQMDKDFNGKQRVCVRAFIDTPKPAKYFFSADNAEDIHDLNTGDSYSKRLQILKSNRTEPDQKLIDSVELARQKGYHIDYFIYSPHIDKDGLKRTGYILGFSKNGENRPKLDENESKKEIKLEKLKRRRSLNENEDYKLPDIYSSVSSSNNAKLNNLQINQLTYNWKKVFNPAYNENIVTQLVNDQTVAKLFILDNNKNIVAAVIGQPDQFGNYEVTEFFCNVDKLNVNIVSKFMISTITKEIRQRFPNNRIYMEANTLSPLPYIGYEIGYSPPSEIDDNTKILLNKDTRSESEGNYLENGFIKSNVQIGGEFRNFLFLEFPVNTGVYSPAK